MEATKISSIDSSSQRIDWSVSHVLCFVEELCLSRSGSAQKRTFIEELVGRLDGLLRSLDDPPHLQLPLHIVCSCFVHFSSLCSSILYMLFTPSMHISYLHLKH